ncbi:hypothetical protein [Sinomicrobium sp.]
MSSYLPEKVYAVCTFNSASNYGKLLTNPDARGQLAVIFKSKSQPLLTEVDKKLEGQFSCKTGWSSGVGTIAFGAGLMAGLGVAAAVATVPVAGWIIGGAIALGCLAFGLFQMFKPKPTCSEMISYQESSWLNPHPTVTFDGHAAVTKQSMISCKEGGFLLPFISASAAAAAAQEIGSRNKSEIALNGVISFIGGMTTGFTGGTSGLLGVGKSMLWGTGFSIMVFQPAIDIQDLIIREGYDDNANPYYDGMTGGSPGILDILVPDLPLPKPIKEPLAEFTPMDDDDMAGSWNLKSAFDRLNKVRDNLAKRRADLSKIGASERMTAAINARIAEIDKAIKIGQEKGFSKANNPLAAKIFQDARSGKYGHEVRNIFTNKNGNGTGMNRESNYRNASNTLKEGQNLQERNNRTATYQANANNNKGQIQRNVIAHSGMGAVSVAGLVLPFVSNALTEGTLQVAADAAMADMANGTSIVSKDH